MEEKRFVDRTEDLEALEQALNREGPELVVLYGRRRVGKSRLLKEVNKRVKFDVWVTLEDADYSTNLSKATRAAERAYGFPSFSPASFKELFESLPKNAAVVIDEFSYLPNGASEFQAVWEETAKPKGMKIILCGSLIRTMEDLTYSLSSPLYGRATKVIKVPPLPLKHVIEWYGNKAGFENVLHAYFALGGIPRYLEVIEKPSMKAIEREFLSKNALLLHEGKLLLKESFPASTLIPKILLSLTSGQTEATTIANAVGIKANEISKYLSLLVDYGFAEKQFPVLGGGKKDTRFYPSDKFISFWARFAWPYYNDIENDYLQQAQENLHKNYNTYAGREFEKTVIEALKTTPRLTPFKFNALGRQWGRVEKTRETYEIDVLAYNDKTSEILFGECKWSDGVDAVKIAARLEEKTRHVKWRENQRKETYAIYAKTFTKRITEYNEKPVTCYDLNDLLKNIQNSENDMKRMRNMHAKTRD